MKKLIFIWAIIIAILCFFYFSGRAQSKFVQCAGKTTKQERCKKLINPKNPGKSIMDAGGVYYCWMHTKQAKH